jgi:hypothetical protein
MQLIAVTTCTDRKRYPVAPHLDANTLPLGPQEDVACEWRKRVKAAPKAGVARDVYCGRSFQEAVFAARAGHADLQIISGGLGLIRADEAIPAYSLSLVRSSPEFVGSRVLGSPFNASYWWHDIQANSQSPALAELVRANHNAVAIVSISSAYLSLIADDLSALTPDELARIRIVGLGIQDACPVKLRSCILPYDDRLDGADSPIRGTRGDYAQRAMRHFIESILPECRSVSLETHSSAVSHCLSKWRRPNAITRPSMTDDEIIRLIKKNWRAIEGQSSRGLRYLRDVERVACEQGRFRVLFHRAAQEVMS